MKSCQKRNLKKFLRIKDCNTAIYRFAYFKDKARLTNQDLKEDMTMLEFRYDTQLLIEGTHLDEDEINEYFNNNLKGDCLLAVGDEKLIKIHFHTNEPWEVLKFCASLGEIFDIIIEDMDRQARGLKG